MSRSYTQCNTRWRDSIGMLRPRWIVSAIVLGVVVFILAIGALSNIVSSGQCATYGQRYGLRSHWTMFYGCFLKLPSGHWVVSGSYQAFEAVHR